MQIGIKEKSPDELINSHPSLKNDKIQALKKSPEGSNLVDTTCIKWWRIGDSCLARSRLTAVPCFASWTLSNRKSTPASAHSRNSFKMYFVH